MNACWIKLFGLCGIVAGVLCGCAASGSSNAPVVPSLTVSPGAGVTGDVLNPTAEQLHELAGELLAYIAANGRLPERLEQLQTSGGERPQHLLSDPVTGQPFVYVKNSLKLDQLRGRLVVYQNPGTRDGQRWVLLMSDQASDGRVVMYVQTITEAQCQASLAGN